MQEHPPEESDGSTAVSCVQWRLVRPRSGAPNG